MKVLTGREGEHSLLEGKRDGGCLRERGGGGRSERVWLDGMAGAVAGHWPWLMHECALPRLVGV